MLAFTSGNGPHCDADYGRILYPAKYGFADKSLSVVNIISIEKYSGDRTIILNNCSRDPGG